MEGLSLSLHTDQWDFGLVDYVLFVSLMCFFFHMFFFLSDKAIDMLSEVRAQEET